LVALVSAVAFLLRSQNIRFRPTAIVPDQTPCKAVDHIELARYLPPHGKYTIV